jgi:mRNA interferase YafQ
MPLNPIQTNRFRKDIKLMMRGGKDISLLQDVVRILANSEPLPVRNRDHSLVGDWKGFRECHIQPDWLLIYQIKGQDLTLIRTGSHSDLF